MGFSGPEKTGPCRVPAKTLPGDSFHLSILPNILQIPILSDHERKARIHKDLVWCKKALVHVFSRPLNATLFFFLLPTVRSPICHLPLPVSQLLNLSSSALQPTDPKKKKKNDLVSLALPCARRGALAGLSDPAAHTPGAPAARPFPELPPSPASRGWARPSPGELRGCSRLPPSSSPLPTPGIGPGFKAASHLDFIFTASPVPGFLLPALERGSRAPGLASPIHREERCAVGDPGVLLPQPLLPPGPSSPLHRLCLKLFPSLLKLLGLGHRKKST